MLEALEERGIDDSRAAELGIRPFKVSMPWPLEPDRIREFARGLDEVLVVEEKRQMVGYQLKEQLYNWGEDVRPRVIGKFDEKGEWVHPRGDWLLTSKADFAVAQIARVIASRIACFHTSEHIKVRLAFLEAKDAVLRRAVATPPRPAYHCSGCPHNTSTRVPQGSMAPAGIGTDPVNRSRATQARSRSTRQHPRACCFRSGRRAGVVRRQLSGVKVVHRSREARVLRVLAQGSRE